ncbi:MAG: DUF2384 domain-containing protein [Opitutales bacterium]|nr:DUF2384 domain-containing protein [Opitutales bacterium]NRA26771.1 DUF2384 domain-containing protein [Opitutales bacterium]
MEFDEEEQRIEEPMALYRPDRRKKAGIRQTIRHIDAGLPMGEFDVLQQQLCLTAEQLAKHLCITKSTLLRRKKAGVLDRLESDRLLRFARLFGLAVDVLDSAEAAQKWLKTPARALEFASPLEFAETEVGAREVENLLGRIEYGVYS